MSHASRLVKQLKDNQEDFEWYPTTDEIIQAIKTYVEKDFDLKEKMIPIRKIGVSKFLDIGAGDGRVLKAIGDIFQTSELFAIEKSTTLQAQLPNNIFVIGSDFKEQSLLDKDVDFTYSNPPYSEFDQWMIKILSESNGFICMTVPKRWKSNANIMKVIEDRQIRYDVFYQTDFLNADRSARCEVDVIMFSTRNSVDAFSNWFDNEFSFEKCAVDAELEKIDKENVERAKSDLISKQGLVNALVCFYNDDIQKLQDTYKKLFGIDPTLLCEIGVQKKDLLANLKLKIKGIKKEYWRNLLNGLHEITSRLTKRSRISIEDSLNSNTSVDFCTSNIYSVVLWCLRNANTYIDSQITDTFMQLMSETSVKRYKSTKKTFIDGDWKYNRESSKNTHVFLDFRFVSENMSYYKKDWDGKCCVPTVFTTSTYDKLNDIITVASNLGFPQTNDCTKLEDLNLDFKQSYVVDYNDVATSETKPLIRFKLYKNGNIHFNFAPQFIAKLNVEFGRLKGWLPNRYEAYEAMESMFDEFNIDKDEALSMFRSNKLLSANKIAQICLL